MPGKELSVSLLDAPPNIIICELAELVGTVSDAYMEAAPCVISLVRYKNGGKLKWLCVFVRDGIRAFAENAKSYIKDLPITSLLW